MKFKPVYSHSHAEIVGSVWAALSDDQKEVIYQSVYDGLKEVNPLDQEAVSYPEVVRASWALGFHYAMLLIENKCLVKAGRGNVGDN